MGVKLMVWRDRARALLGNVSKDLLPDGDLDGFVRQAVRAFSADVPRITYQDYAGDGTTYDLATPTVAGGGGADWVPGFSSVKAVEYPQGERPAELLDMAEVSLYPEDSAPTAIRLNVTTPVSGETARVYYTAPWPVPDSQTTTDQIDDQDREPVLCLAAALAALALAARAATHKRAVLEEASLVGHETEEDRWLRIYEEKRKVYSDHVGGLQGERAASGVVDWDILSSWLDTGHRFLFRGRR